jgi:hypothetical protein
MTGASGGLFWGVAADEVTRIDLLRKTGGRIRLKLSSDNAFIFDCRPYDVHNGCLCVVAGVDAYAADGRRVYQQRLNPPACARRKR